MSDDLLRVSTTNLSSQSETSHYQHGIPGIPTDGKVVLLKNSSNGALIYLVGTNHHSVKKVIDNVKPDVVPIEQCEKRARSLMKLKPKHATLYKLFRFSMRTPGGLGVKLGMFLTNCQLRRLFAHGIFPGLDFKVAMEESSRVGARCFYIDQDIDVIDQQSPKSSLFDLLMETFCTKARGEVEYTRSYAHEMYSLHKKLFPDRQQQRYRTMISSPLQHELYILVSTFSEIFARHSSPPLGLLQEGQLVFSDPWRQQLQ
ncbi:hypothetical protein C5167_047448 [Papaver somniferum]|uniref:Uncharacterized protein n=1 Tax=Papaver somniferum TaxID=3469 RepID=A0A4Y7LGN8_PAPSO|nr:hypothetical protein C5167_047448 [Papaver somniferum]